MGYSRFANNRGLSLLNQETSRVATLWHITRLDSEEFFLTDHDQEIDFQGDTYSPAGAGNASAISSESGVKEDSMDLEGVIYSSMVTTDDLAGGLFDGAKVIQYLVDWIFPWVSIFEENHFVIGDVTWTGDIWKARMNGIQYALEKTLGHVAVKDCPYVFGKFPCNNGGSYPNLILWNTYTLAATGYDSRKTIRLNPAYLPSTPPYTNDYYYNGARIEIKDGANAGIVTYIKEHVNTPYAFLMTLTIPVYYNIATGTNIWIYNTCDKKFATCQNFENNKNFGGNPDMPGMDRVTGGPELFET